MSGKNDHFDERVKLNIPNDPVEKKTTRFLLNVKSLLTFAS